MRHMVVRYARRFDVPLAQAYAWLTDYQDDDPSRTTHIVKKRPVLERHPDRVVLDGHIEVLGRAMQGRAVVHLKPPDHWEAHFSEGAAKGSVYVYHLTPVDGGCRLDVEYRIRASRRPLRRWRMRLLKPLIWWQLHQMWNGFARSMERDLAQPRALPPA